MYDPPVDATDPLDPDLSQLIVQDGLEQLSQHVDTLLLKENTLCISYYEHHHKLRSTSYSDSLAVLKHKILTSNSTVYEYLMFNEQDMELLIEIYKSSNPSEKTLKKINNRIPKTP